MPPRPVDLWLSVLVSVTVAATIAYVGASMPQMGGAAHFEDPVEIEVVESDLAEPFVVCTIRPSVTRCATLDLKPDAP